MGDLNQSHVPSGKIHSLLHKYILRNDFDTIKFILSSHHRQCINDMDHDGRNAIHLSLQTANSKALYLLLYYPFFHSNPAFATLDWTCDSDDDKIKDFVQYEKKEPPYHSGDRLLIKWRDDQDSYIADAFGTLEGYSVRGCGSQIVEELYEQHYNYILDRPNSLERHAREYTAKYARLYSKEINFTKPDSSEEKAKNDGDATLFPEGEDSEDDSKRSSFAADFMAKQDEPRFHPIPLETADLFIPFDLTSPLHLLFSNIYIKSYRERILDCLKVLLNYFRVLEYKNNASSSRSKEASGARDYASYLLEIVSDNNIYLKPNVPWSRFISFRDHTLSTVLHRACEVKDAEIVYILLRSGFNPLLINENGELPLHLAVDSRDPVLFKHVLDFTISAFFAKFNESSAQEEANTIEDPKMDSRIFSALGNAQVFLKLLDGLLVFDNSKFANLNNDKSDTKKEKSGDISTSPKSPGEVIFERLFTKYGEIFVLTISKLISELLLLFEQLFFRCIHKNSWSIFLTLATFSNTLTFHLFSNPSFIHRFIKFSHSFGNLHLFFPILEYAIQQLFPKVNQNKDTLEEVTLDTVKVSIFSKTPYSSNTQSSNSSREGGEVQISDYRGCGYPKTPLRKVKKCVSRPEPSPNQFECVNVNQLLNDSLINKGTWIITHPICLEHLAIPEPTDMPQRRRKIISNFAENPTRLEVIVTNENSILRTDILEGVYILQSPPPVCMADILRVHDVSYINKLLNQVELAKKKWQSTPFSPVLVDEDTGVTPHSWTAARYAAGTVVAAVDAVCNGTCINAFCAVRPPGHHLGTWGAAQIPKNPQDEDIASGSQGFCLINNVAIGAAYAKYMYGNSGIKRIAIIDFDLHHGNGTEQIIRNIGPKVKRLKFSCPCICKQLYSQSGIVTQEDFDSKMLDSTAPHPLCFTCNSPLQQMWFGWRDENDAEDLFFASIHAYDGEYYPGTGASDTSQYREGEPRIINVGVPTNTTSADFRNLFETKICPYLFDFKPDIIFLSAGFDGHYRDTVNTGYTHYRDRDFYYVTERVQTIANVTCSGRVISVLEGGYNTKLNSLSPFAQSVLQHVTALAQTSKSAMYPLMFPYCRIPTIFSPIVELESNAIQLSGRRKISDLSDKVSDIVSTVYSINSDLKRCLCATLMLNDSEYVLDFDYFFSGNAQYSFYSRSFRPVEQIDQAGDSAKNSKDKDKTSSDSKDSVVDDHPYLDDIKQSFLEANYSCAMLLREYFTKFQAFSCYSCKLHEILQKE